jgi:hemerythrin
MSQMYWTPEIAVGVEQIDNEHKALINRVNRLLTAIEEGRDAEEIGGLFDFLHDYTRDHFAAEEKLMNAKGYPEMTGHVDEHRNFCTTLDRFEEEFAREGMTTELRCRFDETIIDWLFDHICQRDRALGKFLAGRASKGLKRV